MTERLPVAELKRRFSEVLARIEHKHARVVIERRGRPVAAMVGIDEIERLEAAAPAPAAPRGLLALAGIAEEVDGFEETIAQIYRERRTAKDRPPPILER